MRRSAASLWPARRDRRGGPSALRAGETVTVAYAKPSSGAVLRDADDLAIESFGPEAVSTTNTVPQLENTPATGAPAIAGTVQAGETLTASTAHVADADGLRGASFAYQWLADDVDIAGAIGSSLTLGAAQVGSSSSDAASRRPTWLGQPRPAVARDGLVESARDGHRRRGLRAILLL